MRLLKGWVTAAMVSAGVMMSLPAKAAEYYPKPFALSATRTTFNGYEAVKTGSVYLLFTKVATTPQNELTGPQPSIWHFGDRKSVV